MGKRELLLVAGFLAVGICVHLVTAPASPREKAGFSWSSLVEQARRHVRGNRANADVTTPTTYPLAGSTTELRVALNAESLTIVGEDRTDVAAEVRVQSTGYDESEAQTLAHQTTLKVSEAGGRVEVRIVYPGPGSQRASITLRVPSALRVNVGRYSGTLRISGASEVELSDSRGDATVRDVSGRVTVSHRGGDLSISDVGALKLSVRDADAHVARVRGTATIDCQGGDLETSELGGETDIESRGTDLKLTKLETTAAPLRVNATNGSVRLDGLSSEARIETRNSHVELTMAAPATVSVTSEGGDGIEVTLPPGGLTLDAAASAGGRITASHLQLEIKKEGDEERAVAKLEGGGPMLTLRSTDGEIVIRPATGSPETAERPERL